MVGADAGQFVGMGGRGSGSAVLRSILTGLANLGSDAIPYNALVELEAVNPQTQEAAAELAYAVAGVRLLRGEDPQHLERARLAVWAQHAPAAGLDLLAGFVDAENHEQLGDIVRLIGEFASIEVDEDPSWTEFRRRRCREVLRPLWNRSEPLRHENRFVEVALARSGEPIDIQPFLESSEESHRLRAMAILVHTGGREHWPFFIEQLFTQSIWTRDDAVGHVDALFARVGAGEEVFDAIDQWAAEMADFSIYLEEMARALARFGPVAPKRYQRFVHRLIHDEEWVKRELGALMIGRYWPENPVPLLQRLMQENDSDVQQAALKGLDRIDNLQVARLAMNHLHSSKWRIREWAVKLLGNSYDPELLDAIFPLTRDSDSDVREAALRAIAPYDDDRILPELLASCLDDDSGVRNAAEQVLLGSSKDFPACLAHPSYRRHLYWFKELVDEAKSLMAWGEKLGSQLTGKSVRVEAFRQGLGQTPAKPRAGQALIRVNVTPLLAGEKHGESIVRGLILHEIGHHLFDIGARGQRTTWGIAASEGLSQIYAILMDERLERKMRSLEQSWGRHFDRLNAYAYNKEATLVPVEHLARLLGWSEDQVTQEIRRGGLPGKIRSRARRVATDAVSLYPFEMAAYPGLQQPTMVFLVFLLCRMDLGRCPLPEVVEAIRRVPANLKDLDHAGVLEVCRDLAPLLGRDDQNRSARRRMDRWIRAALRELEGLRRALQRMEMLGQSIEGAAPQVVSGRGAARTARRSARRTITGMGPGRWVQPEDDSVRFDELTREQTLSFDPVRHRELILPIRRHIRQLKPYLEQLGRRPVMEDGHRTGQRLALANIAGSIVRNSPRLFLREVPAVRSDCYIGVLIDRSGSMEGDKLSRACSFAALVAESAAGVPGISGHVNAFDDEMFVRLGDFRRHTIASLESLGGNNDSGALFRAAQLAQASGSRNRLLIMISDGCPTDCSVESLENLVHHVTARLGIVCAQVAVDTVPQQTFPHYLDLTDHEFHEAVSRFGRLLVQLTRNW